MRSRPNLDGLEIRDAGSKGMGVYATRPFAKGEQIYRLDGRRLNFTQCVLEIATFQLRVDDPLQIGGNLYIALDDVSIKFNHSCDANGAICKESDLIAVRSIAVGEEVTFDYALTVRPSFYSWAWNMSCKCGAAACRKKVGDLTSVEPEKVDRYIRSGLLQDYINHYLSKASRA